MRVWPRALCSVVVLLGSSVETGLGQEPDRRTGPGVTNLAGGRDQPGLFTQRLVMPASFCSPVHRVSAKEAPVEWAEHDRRS